MAIIAKKEDEQKKITKRLGEETWKMGLEINQEKSKRIEWWKA